MPSRYLRFIKLKFWMQIYGLLIRMLDPKMAIKLGETLGQVTPCENPNKLVGGDFLRVHVEINVSKPFCQGQRVALDDNEKIYISFKYKKLPNFCYWCGLISHDGKDCNIGLARKDTRNIETH